MSDYRRLHKESLQQNRPEDYRRLQVSGRLESHLDEAGREADELHQRLLAQLAAKNPYNPTEWKKGREAYEGWLERTARELVLHDLVLVPDEETERAMRDGYTD